MIRFALIGAVTAGALCSALVFAAWMIEPSEKKHSAFDVVALRFPAEWTVAPPVETPKDTEVGAQPAKSTVAQVEMSVDELLTALDAVDRSRAPVAPPQPPTSPDAVFNEGQIAAIKTRLNLTAEQEPHWPEVESALREVSWERKRGTRTKALDPTSVERLKDAAARFARMLNARQKSEVRMLANIVGLKIDL